MYIVYCFYEQFKTNYTQFIYYNYWFWLMIGIMSYLSCTFFFNIMASSVDYNSLKPYWYITYIFELIKNIFFGIALVILASINVSEKKSISAEIPNLDMI